MEKSHEENLRNIRIIADQVFLKSVGAGHASMLRVSIVPGSQRYFVRVHEFIIFSYVLTSFSLFELNT